MSVRTFLITAILSLTIVFADTPLTINIITCADIPSRSLTNTLVKLLCLPEIDPIFVTINYSPNLFPDLKILPAFFLDKDLDKREDSLSKLTRKKLVTPNFTAFQKKTYQYLPGAGYAPSRYLKLPAAPGVLAVYYIPGCPPCKKLIASIKKYQGKDNNLKIMPVYYMLKKQPQYTNGHYVYNSPTIIWENSRQYNHLSELSGTELQPLLNDIPKNYIR